MKASTFDWRMVIVVCLTLVTSPAAAQQRSQIVLPIPATTQIDNAVSAAIDRGDLPGVVIVAATRNEIVFAKAYGHRQLEPTTELMTLDTIFDLASLTKPIATATSAMLLADAGELSFNDKVADHLSEFAANGKSEVRINHLLLHTSGLTPDNALSDYTNGANRAWQNIFNLPLRSPVGEHFAYSDVGFLVLQKIIETRSKLTLDEFTRTRIFRPLGMNDTGFRLIDSNAKINEEKAVLSRIAPTHNRARGEVHDPRAHALGGVAGHAGLFSTAHDLIAFGRMMLGKGDLRENSKRDRRVLSQKVWSQFVEPHDVGRGTRTLGWDHRSPYSSNRGDEMSAEAFGHGGFTGTVLWIDPAEDFVFVFLSNRLHPDGDGRVNRLAGELCTQIMAASKNRSPTTGTP